MKNIYRITGILIVIFSACEIFYLVKIAPIGDLASLFNYNLLLIFISMFLPPLILGILYIRTKESQINKMTMAALIFTTVGVIFGICFFLNQRENMLATILMTIIFYGSIIISLPLLILGKRKGFVNK